MINQIITDINLKKISIMLRLTNNNLIMRVPILNHTKIKCKLRAIIKFFKMNFKENSAMIHSMK